MSVQTVMIKTDKKLYLENLISFLNGPVSDYVLNDTHFINKTLTGEDISFPLSFSEMKEVAKEHPDVFIVVEGIHGEYIDTKRHLNQKRYSL